jgi:predicted nucleic acid-binding protein
VHDALLKNSWATIKQADLFISYIETLSLVEVEETIFRLSPDPKDNYLFDLAIQNNALVIVSDDLLLLNFPLQPSVVRSCNWFLKHYPI